MTPQGSGRQRDETAEATVTPRRLPVRQGAGTALVVDDDEAATDLLSRWLQRIGYDVLTAADGEDGIALTRKHQPGIILLDALLPGRSGYDILKELRTDFAIGLTPVILVTVDDDRARGLAAGASEYLRKPITAKQLREATDVYRTGASGDILVIEDDDDDAEVIRRSLEQIGFSTRRASDGLYGIAMALTSRPAAIVLNLRMPGLDGFGVIERLASARSLTDVPLLILSGADLSLRQQRALATAGHRVFTKGHTTPRQIAQTLQAMAA